MTKHVKLITFILSSLLLSSAFSATPTLKKATPPASTATLQVKVFTRDQLAEALDTVVTRINKCNGNTTCLKGIKGWNDTAMIQVKSVASPYANTTLSLKIKCGLSAHNKTVKTNEKGQFTLPTMGKACLVKGIKPRCGALEKGKKYPELKTGQTLYCITGDKTKLKTTTKNLKDAIINAMKKAATEKMKKGVSKITPAS